MFTSISWQQYAVFITVLTAIYYAYVLLRYYRSDLGGLLKRGLERSDRDPKIIPLVGGLMGTVQPDETGVEVSGSDELEFAETQPDEAEEDYQRLKTETAELIKYAAAAGEDKEGLLSLLAIYLEKTGGDYRDNLSAFIISQAQGLFDFELLPEDLKEDVSEKQGFREKLNQGMLAVIGFLMLWSSAAFSQDGNAGIAEATNKVKGYFTTGCNLMYAIGAVVGLIGATKVYQKWNGGDGDTGKVAASWFGSCIFLVVVATVLQSFFGI